MTTLKEEKISQFETKLDSEVVRSNRPRLTNLLDEKNARSRASHLHEHFCAFHNNEMEEVKISEDTLFVRFTGDSSLRWKDDVPVLGVRNEYIRTFDHIMTKDKRNFIVGGNPGVGKSLFGLWMVYRLLKERRDVSILYIEVDGTASHVEIKENRIKSYECGFYPDAD